MENISRRYSSGHAHTYVLRNVTLDIQQGEFVSVMGPSGAGKSTLLNIIGMLDEATDGEYYFLDEAVHELSEKKRSNIYKEHIGFIFQSYHLIDELTVYENLETPLLYKKIKSAQRKSMVCDMLDRFRIVGKKDLFPSQLSGGQQQLTGNLHSEEGKKIMALFKKLNEDEGVTIIQATHSESNASYGRRIIFLRDGRQVDAL